MVRREDMRQECKKHKYNDYGQCFQCTLDHIAQYDPELAERHRERKV